MPRRNRNVVPDRRTELMGDLTVQTVRRINRKARRRGWTA